MHTFFKQFKQAKQPSAWNSAYLVFFCLSIILIAHAFLLFDGRISIGGDDSAYIIRAIDFVTHWVYPDFQGALYPMLLGVFIFLFEYNLLFLKILSLFFILGAFIFFFKTFHNEIPTVIIFLSLLSFSLNSSILYFASQTYSEACYLFFQGLFLYIAKKNLFDDETTTKIRLKKIIFLSLSVFLLTLTRHVGIVALGAICITLIIIQKKKKIVYIALSFFSIFILFNWLRRFIFKSESGPEAAISFIPALLRKNYYIPSEGNEDLWGLLVRFYDNAVSYLSRELPQILSIRALNSFEIYPTVAAIVILFLALTFIYAIKKRNGLLILTASYVITFLSLLFITLQKQWIQGRLIIPILPFIILLFFYMLYALLYKFKYAFWFLCSLLIGFQVKNAVTKIEENQKILIHTVFKGDKYYGLTPDWKHFLKSSEWISANIPKNEIVASRKPSMSTLYSKDFRYFYGIFGSDYQKNFKHNILPSFAYATNYSFANSKHFPQDVDMALKPYIKGFVWVKEDLYYCYDFQNEISDAQVFLKENNIKTISLNDFTALVQPIDEAMVKYIDPIAMLQTLKDAHVSYIILPSLRVDPSRKTGDIITTMQYYTYFIELKFPGIFTKVHQEGADDDEPTEIFKINPVTI